ETTASDMSNAVTPAPALALYGWGDNDNGQLGDGSVPMRTTPNQDGTATNWATVAADAYYAAAVKTDGTLWAWGTNFNGALVEGPTTNHSTPVQVGAATNWASVAASDYQHTAAVKTDGTLWTWGYNGDGELGNGTTSLGQTSPVRVGTATNWATVA